MKSIFKTMQKKVYKFIADSNVLDGNNINASGKKKMSPKLRFAFSILTAVSH